MNVLIVDDQKDVVDGMVNGINWTKFNVKDVFPCYSATQAKQIITQHSVDIMLSDIEMPQENGLELFSWVRDNYKEIQCIFLTSHADFVYAKEALRLGSFDYILQPARYEEIEEALKRIQIKLKQDHQVKEYYEYGKYWSEEEEEITEDYIRKYVSSQTDNYHILLRFLSAKDRTVSERTKYLPVYINIINWQIHLTDWDSKLIRYTFYNILNELLERYGIPFVVTPLDNKGFLVLLFQHTNADEICLYSISHVFSSLIEFCDTYLAKTAVYIGQTCMIHALPQEVQKLMGMIRKNVLLQSKIFVYEEKGKNPEETYQETQDFKRWQELLGKGFVEMVRNEVQSFLRKRAELDLITFEYLVIFHRNFTMMLFSVAEGRGIKAQHMFPIQAEFETYMKSYETLDSLIECIGTVLALFQKKAICNEEEELSQVRIAKEYVDSNIDKNITRTEIAEYVFLNSEYLSRLFKKEYGLSLKDYIINEKVKVAKQLLLTTKLSVGIIASKVGYSNFSHFTQIFRKVEGITPVEYRQIHKLS